MVSDVFKRNFTSDGEEWVAWVSGRGAYGTGVFGLGNVVAVHFARSAAPDAPVSEAVLSAASLDGLFEEELIALWRGARPIVDAAQLPEGARRRPRTRSLQDHGPPPASPSEL